MTRMLDSLGHGNYRIYAVGAFASNVGTWMQGTAQAWLVFALTESPSLLGLTVGLQVLPMLLLAAWGGVLADRYDRRTILRWLQVGMALPAGLLGVLAVTGQAEAWAVIGLSFLFGVARGIEGPARNSFVSELVPKSLLMNAIALNSASVNSARLIGPGLAGLLIAAFGSGVSAAGWVIVINAMTYAASWTALTRLDLKAIAPHPSAPRSRAGMRHALRYLRTRPDLVLALACVFFLGGFGLNFDATNTLMVTGEFDRGARAFGVAGSVLATGSVVGALIAAAGLRPRLRTAVGCGLVFAALQILSGLAPVYPLYLLVLPLLGLSVMLVIASANAMIQMTCAAEFRGRIAAVYQVMFIGTVPVAAPAIGWLAEHTGARVAVVASGSFAALGLATSAVIYARDRRSVGATDRQPFVEPILGASDLR